MNNKKINILIILSLFFFIFSSIAIKAEDYKWNLDPTQWVVSGMAGSKTQGEYQGFPIELFVHNKMIGAYPSEDDIFKITFVVMDWVDKDKFTKIVYAKGRATASVLWPDDFDINEEGITPYGDYSEFKWNAYFEDDLIGWGSFSSNVFDKRIDLREFK